MQLRMNRGQRELVVDNATDRRRAPPPRDYSTGFLQVIGAVYPR